MKKQIIMGVALIAAISISGQLFAQEVIEGQKIKTKSNILNDKTSVKNTGVCVGKIRCADGSCVISFEQEITSPRDAASGMATGKRMHKPFIITKELDKASRDASSALSTGKVSMSDLNVMMSNNGRSRKIPVINNEFTLPADCPNGDCDMVASWSWGASNSGSTRCEVPFKLKMEDGEYHAINTKGTGGSNK